LSGRQVLVVHEQALYAEAIGRHLLSWGAELVTVPSIDAAVSRSADWPRAALAIIDAARPAGVPAAIARVIAASGNPALPVICVAPLDTQAALARAGVPYPVRMPIRRARLRAAVLNALSQGAARGAGGRDAAGNSTARAPGLAAPAPAQRVLYVDDNPLLIRLVERIFAADPGVRVQTAPDGRTALGLACQQQPDLVLLDLHLPDMSGEALLRQLRAEPRTRRIPAVVVSGDAAPGVAERLLSLGAVAYLTKPFTAAQIRELLRTVGVRRGQRSPR
jgi:CheY-like chemotaxis protein